MNRLFNQCTLFLNPWRNFPGPPKPPRLKQNIQNRIVVAVNQKIVKHVVFCANVVAYVFNVLPFFWVVTNNYIVEKKSIFFERKKEITAVYRILSWSLNLSRIFKEDVKNCIQFETKFDINLFFKINKINSISIWGHYVLYWRINSLVIFFVEICITNSAKSLKTEKNI